MIEFNALKFFSYMFLKWLYFSYFFTIKLTLPVDS
jgi:hypothetical protein